MENVYLIIGFVVLGIIIYVAYLATNTKASLNTPAQEYQRQGQLLLHRLACYFFPLPVYLLRYSLQRLRQIPRSTFHQSGQA